MLVNGNGIDSHVKWQSVDALCVDLHAGKILCGDRNNQGRKGGGSVRRAVRAGGLGSIVDLHRIVGESSSRVGGDCGRKNACANSCYASCKRFLEVVS